MLPVQGGGHASHPSVPTSSSADPETESSETSASQSLDPDQPAVPSKKLKLFDFMSKQPPSSATQRNPSKPDVSRDFQSFLDSSSVGLATFNEPLFANSLRPTALRLFSAPCSSAASERIFSQSGLIMRPTRSRLSPSRLAKLVFLSAISICARLV